MAINFDLPENRQFGLSNIPFGVVSTKDVPTPKIATRFHDQVVLLPNIIEKGLLPAIGEEVKSALSKVRTIHYGDKPEWLTHQAYVE